MTPALTVLVALTLPATDVVQERCELIEVNVVLKENCELCLAQLIFDDGHEVIDWRMTKRTGLPQYDYERKCWVVRWIEEGVLREVRAERCREVWSFEDREINERDNCPVDKRRKLLK